MLPKSHAFVILGPYRSGTSLVSRLVQALGASPGPTEALYEPSDWNPSGYVQRPDVTALNTRLIAAAGGDLAEPPEPDTIADAVDGVDFQGLDLTWTETVDRWLVKDPRFCFTLQAWIRHGVFGTRRLSLVRVARGVEPAAQSALAHYDVQRYCRHSLDVAREMVVRYDRAAAWHCDSLRHSVQSLTVSYEALVADPAPTVRALATFMDVEDPERIEAALVAVEHGVSRVDTSLEA